MATMTVSGHSYDLDPERVREALAGVLPEPIYEHFVVIDGKRWPPKQVLALVTGLDRADFTTHQARRALVRLGFTAARAARHGRRGLGASSVLSQAAAAETPAPPLVEALRPFMGMWVAVQGDDVLVAAPSAQEVVAWLSRHQRQADSMFRVPDAGQAVSGASPQ
jgi:hypothetical protein